MSNVLNEATLDHYASLDPEATDRPYLDEAVEAAASSERVYEALVKLGKGEIGLDVFHAIFESKVEREEELLGEG